MFSELIGITGFAALVALLFLRAPIGLAMLIVGVVGSGVLAWVQPHFRFLPYLKQFKTLLWSTFANYDLSILPLFILMGYLCVQMGASRDLFVSIQAVVGRLRGGMAVASIGACAGFGAVCGSSLATASSMGRIALPELRAHRYHPGFAAGILAAGGTLGILIPPSIVLILYAIVVEASVIAMFQAAILPGILAVAFFIGVIFIIARLQPHKIGSNDSINRNASPAQRRADIRRGIPIFLLFACIISGLSLGLVTPTPAAGMGVFAILIYGVATRRLRWTQLEQAILETAKTTAMIAFILFGAEVLKGFFSRSGLPVALSQWVQMAELSPWLLLVIILLVFILLGCFMDSLSMVLIMVPFFFPTLLALNGGVAVDAADAGFGMDTEALKIWFGILCLVVVELGLITPPVGLNVFILHAIDKSIAIGEVFRGVAPFFAAELIRVALLLTFPILALALPLS